MSKDRQRQLEELLLGLLPADHGTVGNMTLQAQFLQAAETAGISPAPTDDDFKTTREALVAAGRAVKGKGRGGSTARATGATRPDFELNAPAVTPELPLTSTPRTAAKANAPPTKPEAGDPQVLAYRFADRRKNNPEVGLVSADTDPEQPNTTWAYDPHLDPALQFDTARAQADALIADALAGNDPAAMRHALQTLQRMGAPYLQWTGKAERTSFDVDTVSLHVHERIDAMSILSSVSKRQNAMKSGAAGASAVSAGGQKIQNFQFQAGLFEAPFESVPLRSALDFYKHDRGWANRLVAGDSLLVMNSLLHKEGMGGQVQMIYIDPPYGIKYGSNFQPFVGKRDVKDRADADLTQEPEMIKAFRDTWELGIHSYLTYLRDRLLLAKELLSNSGSVFVQISDENLHHVREIMDEVFGTQNYVSLLIYKKTTTASTDGMATVCDYLIWYAKDASKVKYRQLYFEKELGGAGATQYTWVRLPSGQRFDAGGKASEEIANGASVFSHDNITSQRPAQGEDVTAFNYLGRDFSPGKGTFKTDQRGLGRMAMAGRLLALGDTLRYTRYLEDFPVSPINHLWEDTVTSGFADKKVYVVQTSPVALERCLLMTTDPGDLVLDPTCGSGTTAYVAEKWGRRWITCDTSRVAITLAKQRLMTASFDYFALRYPHEGLRGGFIYKTVPHVTLKSIANNAEIDAIYERMHPAIASALAALNAALKAHAPAMPYPVTEGARKGQKLVLGLQGQDLQEWEVPFDLPADWAAELQAPLALSLIHI